MLEIGTAKRGYIFVFSSVIILNWNGLEDTTECLESLKKITYPDYEVIVVDNGSEGNDAQVLEKKFGDYIYLIQNELLNASLVA